ncbi:MAG: site-specific DNA-methyltransferase [Treponema sp.]|nr:site-specific DNA-methyltransferase [Treponema sp.]
MVINSADIIAFKDETISRIQRWSCRQIRDIQSVRKNDGHEVKFPDELARRVIKLYSGPGVAVLDRFLGGGTTVVAAMRESGHWTCSTTRSVVSQVLQIWRISCRNPPNLLFFSGSCSITSVIEQLYYIGIEKEENMTPARGITLRTPKRGRHCLMKRRRLEQHIRVAPISKLPQNCKANAGANLARVFFCHLCREIIILYGIETRDILFNGSPCFSPASPSAGFITI